MTVAGPSEGRSVSPELGETQVLLIDDDPASLHLLEVVLRRMGIADVRALVDPLGIDTALGDGRPDLVLLDWHMPQMNGREVLATIRQRLDEDDFVPVVILTADATREVRDAALASGADDFLVKPYDVAEVRLRVRNLLRLRQLHVHLATQRRLLSLELREHEERVAEHERWLRAKAERVKSCLVPGGIMVHYQPIVDLETGEVVGAEALSRFEIEPRQPPQQWFADAAEVGLGVDLELAAVSCALKDLDRLPRGSLLSVNVSPSALVVPRLVELLERAPCDRVVLELTEHDPIEDYEPATRALGRLRERGVRLAVDDAGAGFASLRHILRLGPDVIKLDIALTRDIDSDPVRLALASALVTFAGNVGASIVAEGIETSEELHTLRQLGIRLGQGYRLARPTALPIPESLDVISL